jgi:CheY-like chemotaxis protein
MSKAMRRKILLVDDDTSLLVTLSDFLRFEGYEVVTATTGEQALDRLKEMTPALIILDMSMPGMGGIGFLRRISSPQGKPAHPVLVLTARANMAEFFANVDVDGFIAKPCSPEDLLMEVSRIIFLRQGNQPTAERGVKSKSKILIAEDDDDVAKGLAGAVARRGYIVDRVSRGPVVVERAVLERPDLLVLKRVLSGMNGDAIIRLLHDMPNTREIPVIVYDDSDAFEPGAQPPAPVPGARMLVSGNDVESILAAIEEVLGRK